MEELNIARAAAAYAGDACFATRRGFLPSDGHLIVAYDNNPTAGDSRLRDQQLTALKRETAKHGLQLAGEASYPVGGESDGYTVALVWRVPPDTADHYTQVIANLWEGIIKQ